MRILVADDDRDTRSLLTKFLNNWNHEVVTARDGDEAIEVLRREPISLVISDWMMPKVDGVELCRNIRSAALDRYIYIILLTAKNTKHELVTGMAAGADDFIVKPFNKGELEVRIRAGARMIDLQVSLEQKNRNLEDAYSVIEKDLQAAAELQRSFLPNPASSIHEIRFEWLFLPCTFVAGDSFNFFRLDDRHIGFYLLDVAGHGIPAAMLSVTLSKILSPPPIHIGLSDQPSNAESDFFSPARKLEALNEQFQNEYDAMRYFTMVYGVIDIQQNLVRISQAGHPSPVRVTKEGKACLVGAGGMPVGMLPDISYDEIEFEFQKGDRLFVYSDGITECSNPENEQFSQERLIHHIETNRDRPLSQLLTSIEESLYTWSRSETFADDVSLLAIET